MDREDWLPEDDYLDADFEDTKFSIRDLGYRQDKTVDDDTESWFRWIYEDEDNTFI